MAIETTLQTPVSVVKFERRTWRVNIESPKGGDYTVTAWRENNGLDASGNVQSRTVGSRPVTRTASALIAGNEAAFVCVDGTSITIAHMIEAISGLIDRWDETEIAAGLSAN